ncbi:hypothetical protein EON63_18465 [archaeon]|nr:MAG: hypothetical protein EON63_18465 [archaeon]
MVVEAGNVTGKKASNKAIQSNWLILKKQLVKTSSNKPQNKLTNKPTHTHTHTHTPTKPQVESHTQSEDQPPTLGTDGKWHKQLRHRILALDCEMVGIGLSGKVSALARCSVVDFEGQVVYDEFVQPKSHVTDFRTKWSGIRKSDISAKNAVTLEEVMI